MNTNGFSFSLKRSPLHIKLIIVNLALFIFIQLFGVIERLSATRLTSRILSDIFLLPTSFPDYLIRPWTFFTSIFAHFDFMHFLSNMVFLYFVGSIYLQFFSSRRLLHVYFVGGIVGGIIEILAHLVFPGLNEDALIVGASGSIMAIFMALAFYRPNLKVNLLIFEVPIFLVAGMFLLLDFAKLGSKDNVAHFAHLGGALVGFLSVWKLNSTSNMINKIEIWTKKVQLFLLNLFKPKVKLKVEKGGRGGKTDEQYNAEKMNKQETTNKILDKISKAGYDSLTKAEKEFLFSQSNK